MENIKKEDIRQYSFYDETKQLCVVLNKDFLKKIFQADNILLEEKGHM